MLKKLMIPVLLLAAAFSAVPAQAGVRFGVSIGGPVYAPAYPYYGYAYPGYYGHYGYYSRPYVYGYYGRGWRWHHHYRYWR